MKTENLSSNSDDTVFLQKLGFEANLNNQQIFASILNRLHSPFLVISVLMEIISYVQILAIGFYSSISGLLNENKYTDFLHTFLSIAIDFTNIFSKNKDDVKTHTYLIVFFSAIPIIWILLYLVFVIEYKVTKSFKASIIYSLYYIGYHIIFIFSIPMGSSVGFFIRPIFNDNRNANAIPIFFSLVLLILIIRIQIFMSISIHSSPDIDIKNRLSFWPQNYHHFLYRDVIGFILAILLEFFRDNGDTCKIIGYSLIILAGIVGLLILFFQEGNIFPSGKIIISVEYFVLIIAPILSLIYHYSSLHSAYFIVIFIALCVIFGVSLFFILHHLIKRKVDVLYLPSNEFIEQIDSPKKCIEYIKIGLLYNAPCVMNHLLLHWALAKYPANQELILFVSYIYYVLHMPYPKIRDLVTIAVDEAPLTDYDSLMFYQIFNRLPTHERLLLRKLEGVQRLYDLPRSSLSHFWHSVHIQHWDEAVMKSITFSKDIEKLNKIYSNLIFENPSSEVVMQEFIKYSINIQGNYLLAHSAEKELEERTLLARAAQAGEPNNKPNLLLGPADMSARLTLDSESMGFSKLSSMKSSIFSSELSETRKGIDKTKSGIQSAVEARPIFYPTYFLICMLVLSFLSFIGVISSFVIANIEKHKLDNQVSYSCSIYECLWTITQILCNAFPMIANTENQVNNLIGQRNQLNELSDNIDKYLIEAFKYQQYLYDKSLQMWVEDKINAILLFSNDGRINSTITLIEGLRIYQLGAKTLAFAPNEYFGSITNPCQEVEQISLLYSSMAASLQKLILQTSETAKYKMYDMRKIAIFAFCMTLGILFVFFLISVPIIIVGYIREYDFFINLYSLIPNKIINKILRKERIILKLSNKGNQSTQQISQQNTQQPTQNDNDNSDPDQNNFDDGIDELSYYSNEFQRKGKSLLPLRLYHVYSILLISFLAFLLPILPSTLIAVTYIHYIDDNHFILNGIYLSSELISSFGLIPLHIIRIAYDFPSLLSKEDDLNILSNASDELLNKYSELFLGETDFFPTGLLISYISKNHISRISSDGNCTQLLGFGHINHECSTMKDSIYFMYGLCKNFIKMINENRIISLKPDIRRNYIDGAWDQLFYPVWDDFLYNKINDFYYMFQEISEDQTHLTQLYFTISLIFAIIVFVLIDVVCILFTKYVLIGSIKSVLRPMIVMDPENVAESPLLLRFLQGDFDNSSHSKSKVASLLSFDANTKGTTMFDVITEGVLIVTLDGTIIASNRSYHEMFSNQPEEIIGTNIMNIFPSTLQPLVDSMNNIKSGQSTQPMSIDTILVNADDVEMNVKVTLVSNPANNQRNRKSTLCAFLFTDKTKLLMMQNELKREKLRVESLLESMLPQHMAMSIIHGNSDVSFTVDKCCILQANFVSFTTFTASMPATKVLFILNLYFDMFDLEISQFSSITKLKTIGDSYLAISGLFNDDIDKSAIDIVSAALKMMDAVTMINQKYDFAFHLRIGIYTGGPLVCGIIGKEKPLFEVFGQAIELTETLEMASLPDKIHISQSTADLINSMELNPTERTGEIINGIVGKTWFI